MGSSIFKRAVDRMAHGALYHAEPLRAPARVCAVPGRWAHPCKLRCGRMPNLVLGRGLITEQPDA